MGSQESILSLYGLGDTEDFPILRTAIHELYEQSCHKEIPSLKSGFDYIVAHLSKQGDTAGGSQTESSVDVEYLIDIIDRTLLELNFCGASILEYITGYSKPPDIFFNRLFNHSADSVLRAYGHSEIENSYAEFAELLAGEINQYSQQILENAYNLISDALTTAINNLDYGSLKLDVPVNCISDETKQHYAVASKKYNDLIIDPKDWLEQNHPMPKENLGLKDRLKSYIPGIRI